MLKFIVPTWHVFVMHDPSVVSSSFSSSKTRLFCENNREIPVLLVTIDDQ